jgi:hypothetical protein
MRVAKAINQSIVKFREKQHDFISLKARRHLRPHMQDGKNAV